MRRPMRALGRGKARRGRAAAGPYDALFDRLHRVVDVCRARPVQQKELDEVAAVVDAFIAMATPPSVLPRLIADLIDVAACLPQSGDAPLQRLLCVLRERLEQGRLPVL